MYPVIDSISEAGLNLRNYAYDVSISTSRGSQDSIDLLDFDRQFPAIARTNWSGGIADWVENRDQYCRQYKGSTYIAIGAIARMAAMQPMKVKRRVIKGDAIHYEPVSPSHPLCELLEYINTEDTAWDLMFYTIGWRLLTGDSFIFKAKNGFGVTKELWPMPSQWVHVVPGSGKFVNGYRVQSGGGDGFFVAKDRMIQIKNPTLDWSGNGRYYGTPTIKAAAQSIDLENEMWKRLYHQFKNFAPPGMVFSTPMRLQPQQLRQLWGQLAAQFAAQEQSGRPMVLHSDMRLEGEFSKPGTRELDYKGSLDKVLEYTLAMHGVPKALVGMSENMSRSNIESAIWGFAKTTLDPYLMHISQHLTQDLAREFEPDLVIALGPSAVDNKESIRKDIEVLVKAGAITPDEVRHVLMEMPPMEAGIGERPVIVSGFQRMGDNADSTEVGRAALVPNSQGDAAER